MKRDSAPRIGLRPDDEVLELVKHALSGIDQMRRCTPVSTDERFGAGQAVVGHVLERRAQDDCTELRERGLADAHHKVCMLAPCWTSTMFEAPDELHRAWIIKTEPGSCYPYIFVSLLQIDDALTPVLP